VNETIGDASRSCPSTDNLPLVPVRHVDMEALVTCDLEKHHFTAVRMSVRLEAVDDRFQRLDLHRPRTAEKRVPC